LKWAKIELVCSDIDAIKIEEILISCGAISISISDDNSQPIYEPGPGENPYWSIVRISALFDKKIDLESFRKFLHPLAFSDLKVSFIRDKNWVEEFQKNFKPQKFGKKLWLYPTWYEIKPSSKKEIVFLDPGIAFGTGSHETTAMCMEYLDCAMLDEKTVVDFGCGSGILALASAKLGAKLIYYYDNDEQAMSSTEKNALYNNLFHNFVKIDLSAGLNDVADLLIANITLEILIELKKEFVKLLKVNAKIVLSGVLESQGDRLIDAYSDQFELMSIKKRNDWLLIEMIKKF